MKLEHERCYTAVANDDEQFDGHFFTAVLTTGIYCRPHCKSRTPRSENVRFYATAAAASDAGFRPCLRCRPESAPGMPEPPDLSPIVSRALRLITEGALDTMGVDELAHRLHISSRQLRRYFINELGAPPVGIAQTRRLLFAKKLIDETTLPMSEVAFSAGYSSIRRFNDALRRTYGRTPTALRQNRKPAHPDDQNADVELELFYRLPYDWDSIMRFLHSHAIPGVESVRGDCYRRTIQLGDTAGVIEVKPALGERYCRLRTPRALSRYLLTITDRIKRLFDLRADPATIRHHLGSDPYLSDSVQAHPGLRLAGAWDGFEVAVQAILGQVSCSRVVQAYGTPIAQFDDPALTHAFPSPERLATASLTDAGLTSHQAGSIRTLAADIASGRLIIEATANIDEAVARLTAYAGINAYIAHMIIMRTLGESDAFPCSDIMLQGAAAHGRGLTEAQLLERAAVWRPWRAYAAMYLWTAHTT